MFKVSRNQVIISALVVMIAVAGYLNISDARKTAESETKDVATFRELPDGTLVPDGDIIAEDNSSNPEDLNYVLSGDEEVAIYDETFEDDIAMDDIATENKEEDPGQAIFVSTNLGNTASNEFFVSAKLEREQVRAKEKDILTEMMGNENLAKEDVSECATALLDIQKRIERESAAEAMIEAKGFKDAYVRIDDTTVDVVVSKSALTEAEIAQIEDIVTRKTGFAAENIKISTLKAN